MALITVKCWRCRQEFSDFGDNEGQDFRYHVGLRRVGDEVMLRFNPRRIRCPYCGYTPGEGKQHELSVTVPSGTRKSDMHAYHKEFPHTYLYSVISTTEADETITYTIQDVISRYTMQLSFRDDKTYDKCVLLRPGTIREVESGRWRHARRHSKAARIFYKERERVNGEIDRGDQYAFYIDGNGMAYVERVI